MAISAKPYLRALSMRHDASGDVARYPFNIPALRAMASLDFHADVTFFIGENGAGKSTMLEAIAVAMGLPAEGGSPNVSRQQQEVSPLHHALRLVKGHARARWSYFLRAESVFNVISYIDSLGPPSKPSLHLRSHGEAFMDLLLGFADDGFYLLDEQEAALSPNRQLAALVAIDQLVKRGAQFIIATHSPILLAYPNAKIMVFDQGGIREIAFEDTEHYAITRDFLNHYPRRLQQLLGEEEGMQ